MGIHLFANVFYLVKIIDEEFEIADFVRLPFVYFLYLTQVGEDIRRIKLLETTVVQPYYFEATLVRGLCCLVFEEDSLTAVA